MPTDTKPTPMPPDTPITRANLAQALAEMMATLPTIRDLDKIKLGDLYTNGGSLARAEA